MGKSTVSCFKIITCAGDPVDVEASESKASGNKRGWSFRKRSARHRVLSNTVISEMQSFDNSPETANVNLQTQPNTTFPEKTSAMPWTDEIPQLSTSVGSKVSDTRVAIEDNTMHDVKPDESKVSDTSVIIEDNTMHDVKPDESKVSDTSVIIEDNTMHDVKPDESKVSDASIVIEDNTMNDVKSDESKVSVTSVIIEDNTMHDVKPDESIIVVIQASIRAFLAQREILKLRNIVKLQAAVRGHLVRRHAVGTLQCVQAIVKMQAVVRARFARLSSEGKLDGNHAKDNHSSKLLEKGNSVTKPNVTYASIEKLLSNKFAHQVLESTPRTKRIHIKCDPSKSDSAWQWLERWMSISSMGVEQLQKPNSVIEQEEKSKFEELSLPANSARSTSSCNQDVGVESNSDAISSAMENAISTREIGLGEDSAYKSSPEASAKSHMTIPESHGTPSSQVSVKAERTKSSSAASKRKSLSAGKMSPTNPDHDSGVRSSLEQLPKERKTGKRRNSFGSARPDNVDQEPRDSSNSLPNYMLATESARAKALANSSPRSSPDMQDKEIYIKKRHSLPSANEKHGSPLLGIYLVAYKPKSCFFREKVAKVKIDNMEKQNSI
ncbi:Protein IQ-DOMAIN 32 [Camellia lanceoleosa]|uniref:Protein IQ-DOMAIN 32 n=1 Tax=Camellia lanceoleosa TaxID=1840588 RepID=A0ACC0GXY6_9ERIC|nr:Protein IQ-DOMAIN 32 [Camellia lanceoleosa]